MAKRENISQLRSIPVDFSVREKENEDGPMISGYFNVYNSVYEIAPGISESFAPGAFSNAIGGDIRALINHDSTLVIGRTTSGTLQLREDSHGLWGDIKINPKDQDAMNLHARAERGDVNQGSIKFSIVNEETDFRDDGSVHWIIKEAILREVSVCTFPAYEATSIFARSAERDALIAEWLERWKVRMKRRLNHGTESPASAEEN